MFQDLHSFKELKSFRVVLEDGTGAGFDCFWFHRPDDLECRISHLVVLPDNGKKPGRALVPTTRVQGLDADRQLIEVDMTRPEIMRSGPFRRARAALEERPLFCTADLEGCRVAARDGFSGKVVDFLVDTCHWDLRYFELDTGEKDVLVDPAWTNDIDAARRRILLDLPADAITEAPEFKASTIVNAGYCEALYRHYTSRQYMH